MVKTKSKFLFDIPEISVSKMKKVDDILEKKYNMSVSKIMERVGKSIAEIAVQEYDPDLVYVLAGGGDNGADGIVAARYLHEFGVGVVIVLASERMGHNAGVQLRKAKSSGVHVVEHIDRKPDLVIDAMIGYNARGSPKPRMITLIKRCKKFKAPVLALDVPTGFNLRTGKFYTNAFKNAAVATLGLPKEGMLKAMKSIYLVDIKIPKTAYKQVGIIVGDIFKKQDWIKIK